MAVKSTVVLNGGLARFLADTRRVGGICGIVFVVLFVAGIFGQGDTPMYGDSAADIRDFFADSGQADRYLVFDWLFGVAFIVFFLPYLSALRSVLTLGDPGGGTWARVAFIGGVTFLAEGAAASAWFGALALTKTDGVDDSILLFANAAQAYSMSAIGSMLLITLLLPAGLIIIASGVLWRWLGWLALAISALLLVGGLWTLSHDPEGALGFLDLIAFALWGIWTLGTCVALLRRPAMP